MVYHAQRVFVHSSRGLSKLRDKLRALNLHYNGVCGHQSWQDGVLRDSYLKVTWLFSHVVFFQQ